MDKFNINNTGDKDSDKPIPLESGSEKTIPFDGSGIGGAKVSHSPLNLGGKGSGLSKPQSNISHNRPIGKTQAEKVVSSERITGMKIFFVKLHSGSITFLDEQVGKWLKENPGIVIKMTNTVTGMLMGKKTEPNLIVTVWY
ncbi:MAG: hypothetical protein ACYSW6_11000 [Planctomycetota bacterium]|jgi:hypothetical protein